MGMSYIAPLVLALYLTRVYGVDGWGRLVIALLMSNIISIFIDYGCSVRGQLLIANSFSPEQTSDNFRQLMNIKISIGFSLLTCSFPFIYFINKEYSLISLLILVSSFLNSMNISWYLRGRQKFLKNSIYENLNKILLVFLCITCISKESGIDTYFLIAIISQSVTLFFSYSGLKKEKLEYYFTVKDLIKGLKDGKYFFLLSVIGVVHNQISLIILTIFNTPPMYIGFFSNADKVIKVCISIFEPIKNSLLPQFSLNPNKDESYIAVKKLILNFLPFSVLLGLLINFYSDKIIEILFNNSNEYAILSLKLLSISIVLYPINIFIGNLWIIAQNNEGVNLGVVSFAIIINIFISIPLLMFYDYTGVLIGSVCAELLICLLFLANFLRSRKNE